MFYGIKTISHGVIKYIYPLFDQMYDMYQNL